MGRQHVAVKDARALAGRAGEELARARSEWGRHPVEDIREKEGVDALRLGKKVLERLRDDHQFVESPLRRLVTFPVEVVRRSLGLVVDVRGKEKLRQEVVVVHRLASNFELELFAEEGTEIVLGRLLEHGN